MQAKPRTTYRHVGLTTWHLIRHAYLSGASGPAVAARYGVSVSALRKRAAREGWTKRQYALTRVQSPSTAWGEPDAPTGSETALAQAEALPGASGDPLIRPPTDVEAAFVRNLWPLPELRAGTLARKALALADMALRQGRALDARRFADAAPSPTSTICCPGRTTSTTPTRPGSAATPCTILSRSVPYAWPCYSTPGRRSSRNTSSWPNATPPKKPAPERPNEPLLSPPCRAAVGRGTTKWWRGRSLQATGGWWRGRSLQATGRCRGTITRQTSELPCRQFPVGVSPQPVPSGSSRCAEPPPHRRRDGRGDGLYPRFGWRHPGVLVHRGKSSPTGRPRPVRLRRRRRFR